MSGEYKQNIPRIGSVTALLFALSFGMFSIEYVFRSMSDDIGKQKANLIAAIVNSHRSVANHYHMSQRVEELEATSLIRCTSLRRPDEELPLIDLSTDCVKGPRSILAKVFLVHTDQSSIVTGVDGNQWLVNFQSVNSKEFHIALWFSRALLIIALLAFVAWSKDRETQMQSSHEAELRMKAEHFETAKQVAHDIRSPISAISIACASLPESSSAIAQIISASTERLNGIANDLLAKSRTKNSSDPSVQITSINLLECINKIVDQKKIEYSDKNEMDFRVINRLSQPVTILCDGTKLSRSVSNLINNAAESYGKSQPGKVAITISESGRMACVDIRDNGCGIPPEIIKRIGEKGFSYGKSEVGGNGLGVSYAKYFAELAGGRIEISSAVGYGTSVRIYMPIQSDLS